MNRRSCVVQEREAVDERQAVRQIVVRDVERAAANDVVVDVPADALGGRDAAGIAGCGCVGFDVDMVVSSFER